MNSSKDSSPPKFFRRFLRWFCHPDLLPHIEGDLFELYEERAANKGKRKADLLFSKDVLLLLKKDIIRPTEGTYQINQYGMLKNQLKLSWRNAIRHKQFTILNVLGLTIGIATSLLIGLFVHHETSYDLFHSKADRIYRVNQSNIWGNWDEMMSTTGPNVAYALKEDMPEFEQITRLLDLGYLTVSGNSDNTHSNAFKEEKIYAAEENFFEVFSFDLVAGDKRQVLQSPDGILITSETMKRYFGKDAQAIETIGKTIDIKDYDGSWRTFQVEGILEDIPARSHIQMDMLVSIKSQSEMMDMHGWKWIWTAFSTYGLVHEGTNAEMLEASMQSLPPKWAPPTTERIFNQSYEEFTAGNDWRLQLQPLTELYIAGSPTSHAFGPTGNPKLIKIFATIGLMVLLLSIINFMNLSTARSSTRTKEVGIRKILGSARASITNQFVIESMLYVTLSTLLAITVIILIIGPFNSIAEKEIDLTYYFDTPLTYVLLLGFIISLGILSGSYPAFYLSSFRPIESLKGKIKNQLGGSRLRNGLVVVQFTISIALVIATIFVQKQLDFTSNLDIGFNKENIIQLHNIEELGFDTQLLKSRLESNPAFEAVGKSFGIPPYISTGDRYRAAGPDQPVVQLSNLRVDPDYIDVLGLNFLTGRNFDDERKNDKYTVILNQQAVKLLGWNDASATGEKLALASGEEAEFEVIGVVKDFNFKSMKERIDPMVLIHHLNDKVWDHGAGRSYYSMRLNPQSISTTADLQHVISQVEKDLSSVDRSIPFEFSFVDKEFDAAFRSEQRLSMILNIFTTMAMVIACLGLYGLAAFAAERRTKELGIRKVLGASVSNLAYTFSSEFTKLVLAAVVIACPLAWLFVSNWLQDFAYKTPLDIWVFALAIGIALFIATATTSYQSFQVAAKNPVDTLKDE